MVLVMQKGIARICHSLVKPAVCGLVSLLWPLAGEHRWCEFGSPCSDCRMHTTVSEPPNRAVQTANKPPQKNRQASKWSGNFFLMDLGVSFFNRLLALAQRFEI